MSCSAPQAVPEIRSQIACTHRELALCSWPLKGLSGGSALEAMARQPEMSGDLRANMIVAAALVEGVALFAVIVCLLVVFA